MVRNHISRLTVPKSWSIKRKGIKFTTRPLAGAHSLRESIPLALVITNMLKYARTRKEVKKILNEGKIFINGKARKELGFAVGLMDVITVPVLNEGYRMFYDSKGKFRLLSIKEDEWNLKPVKIINKTIIKGKKVQLNNSDGTNLMTEDGKYQTNDTLIIAINDNSIKEQLPFKTGARIYVTGGTKRGITGTLEGVKEKNITIKTKNGEFETAKKYAFVIGKLQTLEEK
jgi:small subunit ribosomal protein S4e